MYIFNFIAGTALSGVLGWLLAAFVLDGLTAGQGDRVILAIVCSSFGIAVAIGTAAAMIAAEIHDFKKSVTKKEIVEDPAR